ncbi:unnamed protein product [Caenorhabditis auriculariae]|uniref:Solute-binding protein family 3/N-terminal domain-containing protein n=1 Tax=Caenorhabditis auriculariae TaxID=2777116 RepID=A0A8S1HF86_9PELO|nr:unnamed protein product [Caenorhabditis auriculariae]
MDNVTLQSSLRRKLRVVFARNPPDAFPNCLRFPTLAPNFYCPFPGWCLEVLKIICDAMHVDIEKVISPAVVGGLDWGTLAKVVGEPLQGEKLKNPGSLPKAFRQASSRLLIGRMKALGAVWKNETWTGVLGYLQNDTADTACLMYQMTEKRAQYYQFSYPVTNIQPIFVARRQVQTLSSVLWNAFKPFTYEVWLLFLGTILMFAFALMQSGFMIELYKGILLTALLTSGYQNPFKNSNQAHFVALRQAISANPVVVAKSVSDALDLVDTGKYIYPIQQDSLAMQMSLERCNYVYVSEGMPQQSAYFVFKNDTPLFKDFNREIIMQQYFVQRTFTKYFLEGYQLGKPAKCDSSEYDETEATKPLDLDSVVGIFMVGAIGLGVSIVGFFAEIYHYWHLKLQQRRSRTRTAMNVTNLLNIAKMHFTTRQNYGDIDVMKLVEVLQKSNSSQHLE